MFIRKREHAQEMDGDSDSSRDSVTDEYSNTDQNQSFLGGSEFETVQTCFKNVL